MQSTGTDLLQAWSEKGIAEGKDFAKEDLRKGSEWRSHQRLEFRNSIPSSQCERPTLGSDSAANGKDFTGNFMTWSKTDKVTNGITCITNSIWMPKKVVVYHVLGDVLLAQYVLLWTLDPFTCPIAESHGSELPSKRTCPHIISSKVVPNAAVLTISWCHLCGTKGDVLEPQPISCYSTARKPPTLGLSSVPSSAATDEMRSAARGKASRFHPEQHAEMASPNPTWRMLDFSSQGGWRVKKCRYILPFTSWKPNTSGLHHSLGRDETWLFVLSAGYSHILRAPSPNAKYETQICSAY